MKRGGVAFDAASPSLLPFLGEQNFRLAKAKQAHDDLISAAYRAQADALEIEAQAKRRLADEYDAAQERGEVASGRPKTLPDGKSFTAPELGISSKEIHEARLIRDAEKADPGIVRRTLDEALDRGDEPTKAELRRAVSEMAMRGLRGGGGTSKAGRNPLCAGPDPQWPPRSSAASRFTNGCIPRRSSTLRAR